MVVYPNPLQKGLQGIILLVIRKGGIYGLFSESRQVYSQ